MFSSFQYWGLGGVLICDSIDLGVYMPPGLKKKCTKMEQHATKTGSQELT